MGDACPTGRRFAAAFALLLALLAPPAARAAVFRDVEVVVESEPKGNASHGYAEIVVHVVNRSPDAAREVRLTVPRGSYSSGSDYLRAVSRTVLVDPGKTARVAIAYPERQALNGSGMAVAIDGATQEGEITLRFGSRGYGGGYAPRSSGFGGPGSAKARPLVLYSKSVDTRFEDWMKQAQYRVRRVPAFGGIPDPPGGPEEPDEPAFSVALSVEPEYVRADQAVDLWGTGWLSYSRYDGVVVTATDLKTMPAEVRSALGQYVECGGSLLVLGTGGTLPGPWKPQPVPSVRPARGKPWTAEMPSLAGCGAGFGHCLVADRTDLSDMTPGPTVPILESWAKTLGPWQGTASPGQANRAFPVIDDTSVPVRGLLGLMFAFALVIGPLNLYLLGRWKRKLWLFWTVPAVSFATCVAVFGYMAVSEGWQGHARVEGFTVLDENSRRASTLGMVGFYTPLLPGGGLHFNPDTELAYQNGDDSGGMHSYGRRRNTSASALTMDWTREQHLTSGWLSPRVPAHFTVRKGEQRRERVTIAKAADGRPEAVNGLGADLTDLWYADEAGNLFHAQNVPAGGRAAFSPVPKRERDGTPPTLRQEYAGGNWVSLAGRMKLAGPALLTPRTYLAVMDAAPFLDDPMLGGADRKARSAVFGILKEGGE